MGVNEHTRLRAMLTVRSDDLPGSPTPLSGMRDALLILALCTALGTWAAYLIDPDLGPFEAAAVVFASLVLVGAPLLWQRIAKPIVRAVNAERIRVEARAEQTAAITRRQEFDAQLARALDMSDTEADVLEVVRRGLAQQRPDARSEFLVADSSHAHLQRGAVASADGTPPGCDVDAPGNCAAVRRGQTTVFARDDELDACPRLAGRDYGHCSAVCVPVTVMGRAVGVLHVVDEPDRVPNSEELETLETMSSVVGARLGLLRAMHRTSLQAATDPLTGLANRRTLEEAVRQLYEQQTEFTMAVADLDHFKVLNDAHGHETGDRALRLFARTMRDSVRPEDIVARYGGEEFVIVLAGVDIPSALHVLGRLRVRLAERVTSGATPPYTSSFGLAHSTDAERFDDLFALADQALLEAKRAGRDRIVVADEFSGPTSTVHPLGA